MESQNVNSDGIYDVDESTDEEQDFIDGEGGTAVMTRRKEVRPEPEEEPVPEKKIAPSKQKKVEPSYPNNRWYTDKKGVFRKRRKKSWKVAARKSMKNFLFNGGTATRVTMAAPEE